MRNNSLRLLLAFLLLNLIFLPKAHIVNAQTKNFRLTNYGPKQYGRSFEASNLSVAQDNRGIMYFGNANGILEYDGFYWKFIPVRAGQWVYALYIDSNNTIYVGMQNEFGYLHLDSAGNYKYYSLSDSIKDNIFPFSRIWKICKVESIVFFQAEEYVFSYNGKKLNIIEPKTSFHLSFNIENKFYVRQRQVGLMEIVNDKLTLVKNGELFKDLGIFGILTFNGDTSKKIIVTQEAGIWLMNAKGISKYNNQLEQSINTLKFKVFNSIKTTNNEFVLSSFNDGIVVLSNDGAIIVHYNQSNGLPDNCVKSLFTDIENNIWLTTSRGITKIESNNVLSVFSAKDGIEGSINCMCRFKGILYIGTTGQLLKQNNHRVNYTEKSFEVVPGFEKQVWSLEICNDKLLAGTNDGLYEINGNNAIKISSTNTFCLKYVPSKKLLFAGGSKGLTFLKKIGGWSKEIQITNEIDVKGIAIDTLKNGKLIVWLGSSNQGAMKIILNNELKAEIENYTSKDGLNESVVTPFIWKDKVLFNSNGLILSFISEEEIRKGLPDSMKNNPKYYRGYFDAYPFPYKQSILTAAYGNGRTFLSNGPEIGYVMDNDSIFQSTAFKGLDVGKINFIYPERSGLCWFGANEGLVRFDCNANEVYNKPFQSLVRMVVTINDSILFKGGNTAFSIPVLPFQSNDVKINFVATQYNNVEKLQYSYFLEGYMGKWSEWTTDHKAAFLSLREGRYKFKVKARNIYGSESTEGNYYFKILPPWYRSWWAYTSYIIFGLLLLWLVVKIYTYRLEARNKHLEFLVAERTREVVQQKDKIEIQNQNLEQQNKEILAQKKEITDSINYAKRIQSALLSNTCITQGYVDEIFVLFKPRDIVSGDFYWCSAVNGYLIFVAADCTGHGVPGAFMSMLGMSFLNNIVNEKGNTEPGIILNQLRKYIVSSLHQVDSEFHSKDGMDICLCAINKSDNMLYYAGAFNPLLLVRNGEIIENEVDRMPVAISEIMDNFKTREMPLLPGDCIYLFSDGYCDQFGGPRNKKFLKTNFKAKLLEIYQDKMDNQLAILDKTIEDYKGENFQTDDILVVGMRY